MSQNQVIPNQVTLNRQFFYLKDLYDKYTNSTFPQNFNMIEPIFSLVSCDKEIDTH